MNNILILTDFSEKSWNSIEYALELFQNESCNFYMLNSVNRSEEKPSSKESTKTEQNKKQREEFQNLTKKISLSPLKGSHVFTSIIEEKNIVEATRNQIKNKKIDLIVIGADDMPSKGVTNKNSISEDVITKVKCSVLVVPNEARFKGLKEIAFPTDYTNFYEAKLLQNISSLSNYHKSSIRFLYIAKKEEELNKEQIWNKETLEDYFKDESHSFHSKIFQSPEVSVEEFIDKKNIDLMVLAAKNLNLLEQILFRPKKENLKYYFKMPFLVLHKSNI